MWLAAGFAIWLLINRPLIFVCLLVVAGILLEVSKRRGEAHYRAKGYRVDHEGRDNIFYEERVGDKSRRLTIEGEMLVPGHAVYVPDDKEWRERMPEWARDRKAEIIARIKEELGTRDHEFVEK